MVGAAGLAHLGELLLLRSLTLWGTRGTAGQYELEQPQQLLQLLLEMARRKMAFQARKNRAQRRDARRLAGADVAEIDPAGRGATPSRVIAGQELLRELRRRLNEEVEADPSCASGA
jgi:hypothetical protein